MNPCRFNLWKFVLWFTILFLVGCFQHQTDSSVTATAVADPQFLPTDHPKEQLSKRGIAFIQQNANDSYVYIVDEYGNNLQRLAKIPSYNTNRLIAWSPDGKYIAFTSGMLGKEQIYIVVVDSHELKQLTFGNTSSYSPVWSPDGTQIAFTKVMLSSPSGSAEQIFIMKSNGSGLEQLTFEKNNSYSPIWSTDGKFILFMSSRNDVLDEYGYPVQNAYIMNSDGSGQRPLTKGFVNSASWYIEKNYISVSIPESRRTLKTFIVNVDGEIQDQFPELITDGIPSWSPSGELILFEHMQISELMPCSNIAVMKPDSLNSCFLIDKMPPPVRANTPSWSPDGMHIIFSSNLDGDYDLYIIKTDGSGLTQLTNLSGDEIVPAWYSLPR